MSEAEWLASKSPEAMLRHLNVIYEPGPVSEPGVRPQARVSDRKLRLFATACYAASYGHERAVLPAAGGGYGNWDRGEPDAPEGRDAPRDVAESWCETDDTLHGGITKPAKAAILRDIVGNPWRPVTLPPGAKSKCSCQMYGRDGYVLNAAAKWEKHDRCDEEGWVHSPSPWLTPTVLTLARAAYEDRLPDGTLDPVTLLALADALEEAGCDSEELLRHLRGWERILLDPNLYEPDVENGMLRLEDFWQRRPTVSHFRGCFAVDLVLGKG